MITVVTNVNGTRRQFMGKVWGNEFRVYRVFGDVTKLDEIAESAQEIALETKCERVRLPSNVVAAQPRGSK